MSRILASVLVLLLAVVHAPSPAQALVFSMIQDLFPFAPNEPGILFLTGITLLSLAYAGRPRGGGPEMAPKPPIARSAPAEPWRSSITDSPTR